ncbi:glucosamine kinase [Chitinivorax tropicus]|uniref:Glucosamine kinase n=1 Tax=Chitinivorax tropicus TaxID=714531 RepID=A0A840MPE7_9PROT|nr:BadF/BadG/BcrA/BcrD ATPase family protein [Chitinivorax tropicus]MBB5018622.1 glucosamine kinase [Chitinivorax tropicus]
MDNSIKFLAGVDGGGTRTRIRIADTNGHELGYAESGPSALGQGIEQAWRHISQALSDAFAQAGHTAVPYANLALAAGLSGINNPNWARHFTQSAPPLAKLVTETDSFTALLGAHGGCAGAIIIIGTGSVGVAHRGDGQRQEVGGWGFPSGDEASGAWLGLQAIPIAQQALDGRGAMTDFARDLLDFCGGSAPLLLSWLGGANQAAYAQLAPIVVKHADTDPQAAALIRRAGLEVSRMIDALDKSQTLPLTLCGGLARHMLPYLTEAQSRRVRDARFDAAIGALLLIGHTIHDQRHEKLAGTETGR